MRHVTFDAWFDFERPENRARISVWPADIIAVVEPAKNRCGNGAVTINVRQGGIWCVDGSYHSVMERIHLAREAS